MSKFTVGDQVKILRSGLVAPERLMGQVGTVSAVYKDYPHPSLCVLFINFESWFYSVKDVELVNAPADLYPDEILGIDEKTGRVSTVAPPTGGTKYDSNKPDLSLTPRPALEAMARALGYGKGKYGRDNYRNGFASDRLIAASLRHIHAWQDGEDNDSESGVSHLGHALATLAMLLSNIEDGTVTDTRYKK